MKRFIIWLFISFTLPFLDAGEEINTELLTLALGDSVEKMLEVLGEPNGKMESGDFSIYYFKLGTVKLKSDKISSLDIISEAEWQNRQNAEAVARAENTQKGEEILASIIDDEKFAALPAENRLAFWEQFRIDYPDVDIYVLYSQAKVEADIIADEKAARQREDDRLNSLERRVMMAEAEARNATNVAQNQQLYNQNRYYNDYPSVVVIPQSYYVRKKGHENGHHNPKPTHPIYNGTTLSGTAITPGVNLNISGSFGSQSSSTTTNTSGFVNGQNGVMRIQSSQGFKRMFY